MSITAGVFFNSLWRGDFSDVLLLYSEGSKKIVSRRSEKKQQDEGVKGETRY